MQCPSPDVLEAAGRGDLDPWPRELERHLDGCSDCMDRLIAASEGAEISDDPPLPSRPLPPMPADRYEFIGELGRGGQSRVLRAYDRLLGREVAFKQFVPRTGGAEADALARARFVREVGIMADLAHPGVIPILDLGLRDDWPYATMQVVEGETLREARTAVQADSPELDRLLAHFVSVCETVDFAHGLGIVHRDLKPDNIMLGPFGQTYVLDWALAKRRGGAEASRTIGHDDERESDPALTELGAAVGTPAYMSPEHLDGALEVDPASDIWSLGAILLFVATGRPPFEGEDQAAVLRQVQAAHRDGLPDALLDPLPRELRAIAEHAMSPARDARYASAGAIAQDLEAYRTDRPVSVVRYSAWEQAARVVRHHPTIVGAVVLVALVTAVGLGITLSALRRESNAHVDTANALNTAQAAQLEADRLFREEQRQATRVRVALVEARATEASRLRARKRGLSSRAVAAAALLDAAALGEASLDDATRSTLAWARAAARGELLVGASDPILGYESRRALDTERTRMVVHGGDVFATWDHGDTMTVRRIADGEPVAHRSAPGEETVAIAMSVSARRAAMITQAADGAKSLHVWSVEDDATEHRAIVAKPDGLLAVSDDGTVVFNDPDDVVLALHPGQRTPTRLGTHPNWRLSLTGDGSRVAVSGLDGSLPVLDTKTGRTAVACEPHPHRLTAIAFARPDRIVAGCVSGHIVVCDGRESVTIPAHRSRVTALEVTEDGRFAFSGELDHRLAVSDLDMGDVVARVDAPREILYDVALDAEAERVHVFTPTEVHTWRVDTSGVRPVRAIGHHVKRNFGYDGGTFALPHGLEPRVIAVDGATGTARDWTLPGAAPPSAAHFTEDGALLTVDFAGKVSRFQRTHHGLIPKGGWDGEGSNLNATAFAGQLVAIEHKSPYGVTLWSIDTGERVAMMEGHEAAVFALAFSPDAAWLASGDAAGELRVWSVSTQAHEVTLQKAGAPVFGLSFDRASGVVLATDDGLRRWPSVDAPEPLVLDAEHSYRLIAVDPVHHRVAASYADGTRIAVWELDPDALVLEVPVTIGVQTLAFSADGGQLIWFSSRRMAAVELPPRGEMASIDVRAEAALHDARSERSALLRSRSHGSD